MQKSRNKLGCLFVVLGDKLLGIFANIFHRGVGEEMQIQMLSTFLSG